MLRPFTFRLARMIGQQDFDAAIDYLRANLRGNNSDAASLLMIADCHHWAGRDDHAVVACREALGLDPASFDAHSMLAQLLAGGGEHEEAALHARKGLECYPEPLPKLPGWQSSVFKRLFPRFGDPDAAMRRIEAGQAEWFEWARRYLSWYDCTFGETINPPEH